MSSLLQAGESSQGVQMGKQPNIPFQKEQSDGDMEGLRWREQEICHLGKRILEVNAIFLNKKSL